MSGYNVWSDAQLELKHTSVRSRTIHTYAFSFAHIQKHESSSFDVIERDIRTHVNIASSWLYDMCRMRCPCQRHRVYINCMCDRLCLYSLLTRLVYMMWVVRLNHANV
jgi:hypothetical protein